MGTAYKELFKLYDLIQNGDPGSVKNFLTHTTIDINVIIPCKGISVLHLAVGIEPIEKSKDCTEILLKHGGDPNLRTDDGVTPVHIAAIWGRADNLKLLIGCGGDPSVQDFDGLSAFEYAAREQQWDVYDYLHNVIDQLDDSDDSKCAFTFDLDKILVTTDDIVAEYELITEERAEANPTCRKSEMTRNWCENHSLNVNKLYPTILSETYLLEDESIAWNNRNITLDLTKAETSFKTCLSNRTIDISGVKRLENTETDDSKRTSVYENFSLPGSPKNISHMNYNTKSSLRCKSFKSVNGEYKDSCSSSGKFKDNCSVSGEFKDKCSVSGETKENCSSSREYCPDKCSSSWEFKDNCSLNGKFKDMCSLSGEFKGKLCLEENSLNKALAVAQNRTNEWLSGTNTRRSSASSGVSSNYSAGSIVIANVHEEYRYVDQQENVVLIEKRVLVSPVVLPVDEASDGTPDQTILSIASSLPTSVCYDDKTLRAELTRLGHTPGPIQDSTRTLYLKKLIALKKNPVVVNTQQGKCNNNNTISDHVPCCTTPSMGYKETKFHTYEKTPYSGLQPTSVRYDDKTIQAELTRLGYAPGPIQDSTRTLYLKKLNALSKNRVVVNTQQEKSFSVELAKSLRSDEWMHSLAQYEQLERRARAHFADDNKEWREGKSKTSFTYLLLDPRLTDNLPARDHGDKLHMWNTFVNSIFYVGKGKRSRPYAHLYQALTLWKSGFTKSEDKKIQHILDIWHNKVGVVCLHIFQNIIPAEAYTYEAAMIDVIGLSTLTNLKAGTYYGEPATWPHRERRMLGLYLLYKAMQIFVNEGERQLRPDDI